MSLAHTFFASLADIGAMKLVERMMELEDESERAISVDDFWAAGSCNDEIHKIDEHLEQAGITCDATHDYEVVAVLKNGKTWMYFNSAEWTWNT